MVLFGFTINLESNNINKQRKKEISQLIVRNNHFGTYKLRMLNKLLQSSSQLPFVQNKKSQGRNSRQSLKSDTESVSLSNLSSSTNFKKLNIKTDKAMAKIGQTEYKMKRMKSSNDNVKARNRQVQQNSTEGFNIGDSLPSHLSYPTLIQTKIDFAQTKHFSPSKDYNNNQQFPITIQEKLQNVSCLYTNHLYTTSNQNFVDEMRLQKYRLLVQNERQQKHSIMKQLLQKKEMIEQLQKEKEIVMFAYQTLEIKLKQHEKTLRKLHFDRKKQKLSMAIKPNLNNVSGENRQNESESNLDSDNFTKILQEQYRKTRQLMTQHGIMSSQQSLAPGERNCNSFSIFNMNKKKNNTKIITPINNKDTTTTTKNNNEQSQQQQQWMQKYEKMQKQMKQIKSRMTTMQEKDGILRQTNQELQRELTDCRDELQKTITTVNQKQLLLSAQQSKSRLLHQKLTTSTLQLQSKTKQLQQLITQAKLKQQTILQLQQSNYLYLQKQQREQQQIQMLKQFTHNLKLNDEKITVFVQEIFTDKVEQAQTGDRLFKQDLSYILHLVKKKQTLYDQLIKEYQDKARETQTRCYLMEKKLFLADAMVKKVQNNQKRLQGQWKSITNQNSQSTSSSKSNLIVYQLIKELVTKAMNQLEIILETYHLDKRML